MTNKKKLSKIACLMLGLILAFNGVKAQSALPIDSIKKHLDQLFSSPDPQDKILLNEQLTKLLGSTKEADMALTVSYYYKLKNTKMVDSVLIMEAKRFPDGIQSRSVAQRSIYDEKTAKKMEVAYLEWIKRFPPENFPNVKIDDRLIYDYARSSLADAFEKEKNTAKAIGYINMLEVDFWKGNAYAGLADAFYKNGDLANAEIYAKKAMDVAESYTDGKKGTDNAAQFAASGYGGLCSTYAGILFEEKKYSEALKYTEISYKNAKEINPRINARYADILMALNRNQEAFDKLDEVVKSGKATPEIADNFKKLYIKLNRSDAGFSDYSAAIRKGVIENLKKKLTSEMVKEQASGFTLTDLSGNKVSLQDMKGKIVILDFWATWCTPCKASFPAMQMATNKYKDDPNVKFLFIHTWEKSATPVQDAKTYIESMKYSFEVLMDLKDPDTKENKVVTSYKVYGIPAKFIIDANGNIRFKLTGFNGSNEAAVDEISMMIDMAKKNGI